MTGYTLTTMTVGRFKLLHELSDIRLASRIKWLPGKIVAKNYELLMTKFSLAVNESKVKNELNNDFYRSWLWNQVHNYLPILRACLLMPIGYKPAFEAYKEIFGDYPRTIEDINKINDRIKSYERKLKSVTSKKDPKADSKFDFAGLVQYVSESQNMYIPDNMKLYEFVKAYKSAIDKQKRLEKLQENKK